MEPAKLNTEQRVAVEHGEGPLLIVAGAGTGKTTVLTERIAWLIREKKAEAGEILALTFTEKAAGEMEERIDRALPMGYVDVWAVTFHAFCERVLREHGLDIGLSTNFKILSTAEQWLLVRRNLDAFDLEYYKPLGNPTKFVASLVQHFSRAKDEGVTPEAYAAFVRRQTRRKMDPEERKRLRELATAYATYERLLRGAGHLDFGDLIVQTLLLFTKRPQVLNAFRKRFPFVLVDEFQDTNFAQYQLLKLLAAPKNNLTVVGDDDQSIYKFRGAALSNILEFKRDFPDSREVVLTENYRSRQNILDAAYGFIQHNNPNRLEVKLAALAKPVVKKLHASRAGTGTFRYERLSTADDEASWVVERLLERKTADPNLPWGECAILLRANNQAERFVAALTNANIPCHFLASKGLYQRPEVLTLLAFLRLLVSLHDSNALYRLMTSKLFDIPHADVSRLLLNARRRHAPLLTVLQEETDGRTGPGAVGLTALRELIEQHAAYSRRHGAARVLLQFFKTTKYLDRFDRDTEYDKIMNVAKFWRRVTAFEEAAVDKSVAAFMEEMDLVTEIGDDAAPTLTDDGPDAVRIMTVHGAKGLEFSFVFLPQLIDQRFPSSERPDPIPLPEKLVGEILLGGDEHLEEERRLLYVGMTRAKDGLFLSSAEDYGGTRKRKPSRFLFELGLVEAVTKPRTPRQQPFVFPTGDTPLPPQKAAAPLPPHFSFTQLKAFEACPKQYHYAHVLGLPVEGKPSFSFGKSVHAALKDFYQLVKAGKRPTEATLLALYERHWNPDWYGSDAEEARRKAAGAKALKEFFRANRASLAAPLALEQGFHLKVGPHMLKGRIDRIDGTKDRATIIDYKTGQLPKTKKADDLDQLLLYAIAANEVLGFRPEKLVYYYLEANMPLEFPVDEAKFPALRRTILNTIDAITKSDFAATPGFVCKTCDFRDICEDRAV